MAGRALEYYAFPNDEQAMWESIRDIADLFWGVSLGPDPIRLDQPPAERPLATLGHRNSYLALTQTGRRDFPLMEHTEGSEWWFAQTGYCPAIKWNVTYFDHADRGMRFGRLFYRKGMFTNGEWADFDEEFLKFGDVVRRRFRKFLVKSDLARYRMTQGVIAAASLQPITFV